MKARIYLLVASLAVSVTLLAEPAQGQGLLRAIFGDRAKSSSSSSPSPSRKVAKSGLLGGVGRRRHLNRERQGGDEGFGDGEGGGDPAYDDDDFPPPGRDGDEAQQQGFIRRMTSNIGSFFGRLIPFRRNTRRRPLFGRRDPDGESADGAGSPEEFFADFPTAADGGAQLRNGVEGVEGGGGGKRRRQRNRDGSRRGYYKRRQAGGGRGGPNRRQRPGRPEPQEADDYDVDDYSTAPTRGANGGGLQQQQQQQESQNYDYSAPTAADGGGGGNGNGNNKDADADGDADDADADVDPDVGFQDGYLSGPDAAERPGQQQQQQLYGGFGPTSNNQGYGDGEASSFFNAGATNKAGLAYFGDGAGAGAGASQQHQQPSAYVLGVTNSAGDGDGGAGAARKQGTAGGVGGGAKPTDDPADVNFPTDVEKDFAAYGDKDEAFFDTKK